jgi:uncharacterized protein
MKNSEKYEKLKNYLSGFDSAVIAFSAGVDSTFLACAAKEVIKGKLLLVTANSITFPDSELDDSVILAKKLGLSHRVFTPNELENEDFIANSPQRCYYCKLQIFSKIKQIANEEGITVVFDGSNSDDLNDYRPGRKALTEIGIISPLCECGFTKQDIRNFSAELGLTTAAKPSLACLASRLPYGEKITKEKLEKIGSAEEAMRNMGLIQFRVRFHGDVARIEVAQEEMDRAWEIRSQISKACKMAGFLYASIDLDGYRCGAMNEVLQQKQYA